MDKETVIAELQRVAKQLDTNCLSRSEFAKEGKISSGAVEKSFGSWNEAIVAAGLQPLPQGGRSRDKEQRPERQDKTGTKLTDEELLRDLLRLARELGKRPSGNQIAAKGKYGPDVYCQRWESVARAFEEATRRFPEV